MATQLCEHTKTIELNTLKGLIVKSTYYISAKLIQKSTTFLFILNTKWNICTICQTVLLIDLFLFSRKC